MNDEKKYEMMVKMKKNDEKAVFYFKYLPRDKKLAGLTHTQSDKLPVE